MKHPPFRYHRPAGLDEAVELLAELGDTARVLAGGQSLLPILALRLGRPDHLIDIGRIDELCGIRISDGSVSIGALVRHGDAERSTELAEHAPLVHQAMPLVGHRAIRTRGTVCGSIAHNDPAAEMPAVCLAAGATMHAVSTRGSRDIAASDFFLGYLETALEADEILTSATFPTMAPETGTAVVEESRRHGDYALVGLACSVTLASGQIDDVRLAVFGAGSTAIRASVAEAALRGLSPSAGTFARAATLVGNQLSPSADIHASANYRRHLAGVLTRRGLGEAIDNVRSGATT